MEQREKYEETNKICEILFERCIQTVARKRRKESEQGKEVEMDVWGWGAHKQVE